MTETLRSLGERRIVREIIPKYVSGTGDDCALIGKVDGDIVLTTDPVPVPAALSIGGDRDPYRLGWLLVTINASDLAAAGAMGVAFVAALEAPPDSELNSLERLLAGVADACRAEGLQYVGGNLREGGSFAGVGTALGKCAGYPALTRVPCRPDDTLVSVGVGGVFWRDALAILRGERLSDPEASPVFRPRSQLTAMREFARRGLVQAAMDNSDGLLPTLSQLANSNDVELHVDLEALSVPAVEENVDPARLWMGWGDWNVIAAVRPDKLSRLLECAGELGHAVIQFGRVVGPGAAVVVSRSGRTKRNLRLESERFADDSWFSTGIEGYVKRLLDLELP
jgi:thiamine-monophosphate kinase